MLWKIFLTLALTAGTVGIICGQVSSSLLDKYWKGGSGIGLLHRSARFRDYEDQACVTALAFVILFIFAAIWE